MSAITLDSFISRAKPASPKNFTEFLSRFFQMKPVKEINFTIEGRINQDAAGLLAIRFGNYRFVPPDIAPNLALSAGDISRFSFAQTCSIDSDGAGNAVNSSVAVLSV